MIRLTLALAVALCVCGPAASLARPVAIGESGSSSGYATPAAALGGPRALFVESQGTCGVGSEGAPCRQRVLAWRGGVRRELAVYDTRTTAWTSGRLVTELAASRTRVAQVRTAFAEFRGSDDPHDRQVDWWPYGRSPRVLSCCALSFFGEEHASLDLDGRFLASAVSVRRGGVGVYELNARGARRRAFFARQRSFSFDHFRLAGRYLAIGQTYGDRASIRVYDWRSRKLAYVFRGKARYDINAFDLQSNGTLAIGLQGDYLRSGKLPDIAGWASPARPRFHSLGTRFDTYSGTPLIARDRVAVRRPMPGRRNTHEVVVTDLEGRLLSRHRFTGRLADFDGSCLLWAEYIGSSNRYRVMLDRAVRRPARGTACR